MTWVMAQPTIFGQVICLSDIQVTFTDLQTGEETYLDCVQKSYAMDKNIIAGFAGNVLGGFAMLSSLSKAIKANKKDPNELFEPEFLINEWSKIAKSNFARLIPEAKDGDVHILIGGISHTVDVGIPGMGKPTVAILKSPDFVPEYTEIGKWASIGSGASEQKYRDLLDKATGDPYHPLMQHGEEMYSQSVSIYLSYEIQKMEPTPGISQHYHLGRLTRASATQGTSDHKEYPATGEEVEIKMPNVAHSLDEFLELIKTIGKAKHKAVAGNKIYIRSNS